MKKKLTVMLFLLFFLSGCAFISQQVKINPAPFISTSQVGGRKTILLEVKDEREDQGLGYRGTAYGRGAQITTNDNVVEIIKSEIMEGLRKKGFSPVLESGDNQRNLVVEVRMIEYSTSTGFWTGGIHTKATFKALAKNKDKSYEQIYRVENEERVMIIPTAGHNEKIINNCLTQVLNKLFDDERLFAFLASD